MTGMPGVVRPDAASNVPGVPRSGRGDVEDEDVGGEKRANRATDILRTTTTALQSDELRKSGRRGGRRDEIDG